MTPEQLAAFARDGYVVLRGAVPAGVVASAGRAADRIATAPARPGPVFDFPLLADVPELAALLPYATPALTALLGALQPSGGGQLARTHPPFPRGAGRPHVDGSTGEPGGRPDSFSVLAGFVLSDQRGPDGGGLWVWPGSHREHAAHFARHGFWSGDAGYPDVATAVPVQLEAEPGDLTLCHYLLGHCPGGVTDRVRTTFYLRVTAAGHRWQDALVDPLADFPGLQDLL